MSQKGRYSWILYRWHDLWQKSVSAISFRAGMVAISLTESRILLNAPFCIINEQLPIKAENGVFYSNDASSHKTSWFQIWIYVLHTHTLLQIFFKLSEILLSEKGCIFLITPGEFCNWKMYCLEDINAIMQIWLIMLTIKLTSWKFEKDLQQPD